MSYHGEDLITTAKNFVEKYGDQFLQVDPAERQQKLTEFALNEKLTNIKNALLDFGVVYDVWFSEQSLHQSGAITKTIDELRQRAT